MTIFYFISDDYERRTGGYVYNEHLASWLDADGSFRRLTVPVCFPEPAIETKTAVRSLFAKIGSQDLLVTDHIYGCMFLDLLQNRQFRLVLIFHHSLAEENNTGKNQRDVERAALSHADLVIATSTESGNYLARHYDISSKKVVVALPGNEKPEITEKPAPGAGLWRFLSLGAVIPRKRYEFAIEALGGLASRNWHFAIIGNTTRYPNYVEMLEERIEQYSLSGNVEFTGELSAEELEQRWRKADLYLASSAYEGYGMSISEAMCRGLPVISTASGAVAGWAGEGAIILPDDVPASMTKAIVRLTEERGHYEQARQAAIAMARTLPGWDETMRKAGSAIRDLSP
ncbi:glycosyltransferase family 4 protein [Oryzifoliimicrobium ureilyticus]|uniref:glycosyltransferase family 4 protein n=1 Tax=Oryzifoliimicrobium ureilyticus TaxID=3113724 RepID=UPI00307668E8